MEVRTLSPENPDEAINCHSGVSQAVRGTDVSAVDWMDVNLAVSPARISW